MRVAALLPVHRQSVEEILYVDGRRKLSERLVLSLGKTGGRERQALHAPSILFESKSAGWRRTLRDKDGEVGLRLRQVRRILDVNEADDAHSRPRTYAERYSRAHRLKDHVDILSVTRVHSVSDDAIADSTSNSLVAARTRGLHVCLAVNRD